MSGTMAAGGHRTITAVFDDMASAERAAHELAMRVGGVRGRIHDSRQPDLGDLALPQTDLGTYQEAIRRGHVVLSAEVPADQLDTAAEVIEACDAIDFDAREEAWRTEGWNATHDVVAREGEPPLPRAAAAGEERPETIPLAEEHLRVGKRETGHGRVRLRSYVVETPVEEQVSLRREHVDVERHRVDRPAETGRADDLFRERTIEATETSEEAVVQKEVRVTEEVALHKEAEQRTETVRDTVRRTEVEVEDDRLGGTTDQGGAARPAGAGTRGKDPSRGA
jgi:uncharacterized protein (TIGR02271 family)